ncbi:MAG: large conductance mechanosensitive channel protein MscL [Christensenella sp.]|uniref:large conductance mechanosensitive channel protein MscL n=1 Tax=Christensenella sp. TaxID=1935934 RepID=UPI002B204D4F|nr:large conductance mechanosensitive channel protein MscL [Christensenella sp.]MEA5004771.1 large conductance mechanosensitive channel protein MscL [Christensenella sp.]
MEKKKKGFIQEFKEFISRGSVMDLAVGIIIGGAFTAIVNALVENILNPIIGLATGGMDFSSLKIPLTADPAGAAIQIGLFINAIINFLLIALVIFLLIKGLNKLSKKPEPEPEKAARLCPYCKGEIADDATRCPHCTSVLPDDVCIDEAVEEGKKAYGRKIGDNG